MKITRQTILVLIGIWTLFTMVYPVCNYITSLRSDVHVFCFSWERNLPFVPILFIPYMSIDLFFILAPFIAGSANALRAYTLRIAAAILSAGTCFLVYPMKYGFDRPPVAGLLGMAFDAFRAIDLPFNQCPSLHIAFLVIMRDLYARRSPRGLRLGIDLWFGLIVISTVLTGQHHVIDLIGGGFLGVFCLYLFPYEPLHQRTTPNLRIASFYTAGAIALITLSFALTPWSYLLLWPAFSLASSAAGYLVFGSTIFRKQNGRLPFSTWFAMWPVLLGERLCLAYSTTQCQAHDPLIDNLWIGRRLSCKEAEQAVRAGVTAVIDLTGEFSEPEAFRRLNYLQLSTLDLTAPNRGQIDQAIAFIQQNIGRGIVFIHSKAGYSRTAVVAGAYLLTTRQATTVRAAIEMLRNARPSIIIRPEALRALEDFNAVQDPVSSQPMEEALLSV